MKHFENELPEGYIEAKVIDAKNKKTTLIFTLVSFGLFFIPFLLLCRRWTIEDFFNYTPTQCWTMIGMFLVYTVFHELTHGAAYKILTKQKLSFGIGWGYACCGVPDIYVYRLASIISSMAPFVVWGIVFLILCLVTPGTWGVVWLYMLSCHTSGCVGDLYLFYLLLIKYRDPLTMVKDTGPLMTIYKKTQTK